MAPAVVFAALAKSDMLGGADPGVGGACVEKVALVELLACVETDAVEVDAALPEAEGTDDAIDEEVAEGAVVGAGGAAP